MPLFDRFPLRFLAPNALTCISLVLGMASIRTSLTATSPRDYIPAAWMILYAVLLDKADGAVARRLGASSEFGVQLDSFADFVTFGLSPAALFAHAIPALLPDPWASGTAHTALLAIAAVYAVSAALRLAKFNVTTSTNDPRFFRGLPSTSSGGILASAFLALDQIGAPASALTALVPWMALNAALMVSNLPQPKFIKAKNPVLRGIQYAVFLSVYVLVPLNRWPVYLVSAAALYSFVGFFYGIAVTSREAPPDEAAPR